MAYYRLNLNQQSNGDYEVHKDDCDYYPKQNYDELGTFSSCTPAVAQAKRKHPNKKITDVIIVRGHAIQASNLGKLLTAPLKKDGYFF